MLILTALKVESSKIDKFIGDLSASDELDLKLIYTGAGKVNAARVTQKQICEWKPTIVVNYGTAGSQTRTPGTLVECVEFFQRDVNCMSLNCLAMQMYGETICSVGPCYYPDSKAACYTGDSFVSSGDWEKRFDVVDMEAYAIARVCKEERISFKCFKYISDGGDPMDWALNIAKGQDLFLQKLMIGPPPLDFVERSEVSLPP